MLKVGIKFPKNEGGYKQAYTNNDIEVFKGEELFDNLVRETIQNALDAPKPDCDIPVRVVFRMQSINKREFPVFTQYEACLKGCRRFWGDDADIKLLRFLREADSVIEKEEIPVFVASDYNTKGLCGSRTRRNNDPWEALTNSDGVSAGKTETSGGSYGIGKNAPFACSGLSLVFYNTYAIDGEKAFTGVAKLATLYDENNRQAQRIGKYQKYDEAADVYEPIYGEDECKLRDLFSRNETGTDVIVTGFNQANNWEENVKKAVLKHFFVAISEKRLVVEVEGNPSYVIDSERLPELIADCENDNAMATTMQLYKAFVSPDKKINLSIETEGDAELYIKADPSFGRNIANFRNTGMLVGLKSRRIFQHYAAVLIIRDKELSSLLKDTEPPRHNRWDYKLITGEEFKERRKRAKNCITLLDNQILSYLKDQFEVKTEDSVDAEGVGDYLPDELDDLGGNGAGDDILRAKIKIGKMRIVKDRPTVMGTEGEKSEGKEVEGDVHNRTVNPNPGPAPIPKPVIPDEDGKEGAKQGTGSKNIVVPVMQAQRAFPVNGAQGLYKIVLKPADSYGKLYISCSAIGEDGTVEKLTIDSIKKDGANVPFKGNEAGPVSVEKDMPVEFFVRFNNKEKMTLSLSMREDNK